MKLLTGDQIFDHMAAAVFERAGMGMIQGIAFRHSVAPI